MQIKEAFHNKAYDKSIADIKKQVKWHKLEIGDNTDRRIIVDIVKSERLSQVTYMVKEQTGR